MHCNSFYELAGLDPQNESLVSSIRGSSVPPRGHAVLVSGRPGVRCTKTLDQHPVFTLGLYGEVLYAAFGSLGTLFHPRFNWVLRISVIEIFVWNPKLKSTNLTRNFMLVQDTVSFLSETENSELLPFFPLLYMYISVKERNNTHTWKPTFLCVANKIGQQFTNMTQLDVANAQTSMNALLSFSTYFDCMLGLKQITSQNDVFFLFFTINTICCVCPLIHKTRGKDFDFPGTIFSFCRTNAQ